MRQEAHKFVLNKNPIVIVEERIRIYKSNGAMHHFELTSMNKTLKLFNSNAQIILEKIKEEETEVNFIIDKVNGPKQN
jgi:phosphoribosyl-ATP pyrophosphohydrolase